MKHFNLVFIAFLSLIFAFCSSNPVEKGDRLFSNGSYTEALKEYLTALKENPDSPALKEKIALSYFREGEKFYETHRLISGFEVRVARGNEFLPESPSDSLKRQMSSTYLALARACQAAKPDNPRQGREFLNKTVNYLNRALELNPQNQPAREAFDQLTTQKFSEMLNKGIQHYNTGVKDPQYYISAEYYLTKALQFKPEHSEAAKYLKLARQKGLQVLEMEQQLPFAITDQLKKDNLIAFYTIIHNNLREPITADAAHFYLIFENGSEKTGMASDQFAKPFAAKSIKPAEEAEGVVAFELPGGKIRASRLEYRLNGEIKGYKNFP